MDLKKDEVILLEELQNKEEYERVCVQAKVLEVMDPITVASGKKVQDDTVADSTLLLQGAHYGRQIYVN